MTSERSIQRPEEKLPEKTPTLYLLPVTLTEGGNPAEVMPQCNIDIARRIKYFIVENIRTARRSLKRMDRDIDIDSLTFFTLDEHTPSSEVEDMLTPLAEGHDMAVMSEAGCPAVADPGADAVAVAQRKGYRVVPLIGPSSLLLALMGSGFNGQTFAFAGYLPVDSKLRISRLKEMERRIRNERQTQIFIETPYRNNRLIDELSQSLPGNMLLCVASDITGPRQSIITRRISEWRQARYDYNKIPTIFLLFS